MTLKDRLKRIIRRPTVIFVTWYANYIYGMGVKAAEQRHAAEGKTIYLAEDTFRPGRLVTYNKAQFKAEKSVYGMAARLLTINTLRSGCYYHTADRFGGNGLREEEKDIRRKAFIKERLTLAGLI